MNLRDALVLVSTAKFASLELAQPQRCEECLDISPFMWRAEDGRPRESESENENSRGGYRTSLVHPAGGVLDLPDDILDGILLQASLVSLGQLCCTCRKLRDTIVIPHFLTRLAHFLSGWHKLGRMQPDFPVSGL